MKKRILLPLLLPMILWSSPSKECVINNKNTPVWICPETKNTPETKNSLYSVVKYEYNENSSLYEAYKLLVDTFIAKYKIILDKAITKKLNKKQNLDKRTKQIIKTIILEKITTNFTDYIILKDKWNDNINFYLYGTLNEVKLNKELQLYIKKNIKKQIKIQRNLN